MHMNKIILFSIFLLIFIIIPKEAFVKLTDFELNAIYSPFDSEKSHICNKILDQYKFYPSVHKERTIVILLEFMVRHVN